MPHKKREYDWAPIRTRYLESLNKPTFKELADEFGIPEQRIVVASSDESWPLLRLKRTSALVERSGATELLLAAAATQRAVTDRFSGVTLGAIEEVEKALASLGTKMAASTRMGVLNTASFAIANLARALKDAGVVGLPRALMDELDKRAPAGVDGKDYLRSALQQINVTVNAAREGKSTEVIIEPEPVKYPKGGVHAHPDSGYVEPTTEVKSKRSRESVEISRLIRQAERRSLDELGVI